MYMSLAAELIYNSDFVDFEYAKLLKDASEAIICLMEENENIRQHCVTHDVLNMFMADKDAEIKRLKDECNSLREQIRLESVVHCEECIYWDSERRACDADAAHIYVSRDVNGYALEMPTDEYEFCYHGVRK